MLTWPIAGFAGVGGLALGSYATTAGIRLARAENTASGRSHCDSCGVTLSFSRTMPVVSYLWSKGACSTCRAIIDPTHLLGEVLGAAILLFAAALGDPVRGSLLAILGLLLLTLAVVDARTLWLPEVLLGAVSLVGVALAALRSVGNLELGAIAAAVTLLVTLAVRWMSARGGKAPGLGFGDVWLLSALALWLGLATPWLVVAASLLGLVAFVVPGADRRRPWGPAICAAGWAIGMAGEFGVWPTIA